MPSLRQWWLRIHRWVALSVGWVLIMSGLTGAILVLARPMDRWLHDELFIAHVIDAEQAPSTPFALESVVQRLRAEFGPKTTLTLRPPRQDDDTLWVLVRGPWSGTVYLNPVTGKEQGRRGENEGFANVLFELHSSLWLQDTGKALLACVALVYVVLLITGLILWWPRRWPPSWRIELSKGTMRALFDLHRISGAAIGLIIAVSVVTGAYMAWRPIGGVVTALGGVEATSPPKVVDDTDGEAAPLDQLVSSARSHFPSAPVGYIQVPAQLDRPVRIRFILPDDPHPNGLTSVWLHPRSGEVLGVHRWSELDPGARAVAVIYPLHTGKLGGIALEIVIAMSGLVLAMLGVTGVWLWWRRRSIRRSAFMRVSGSVGTPRRAD